MKVLIVMLLTIGSSLNAFANKDVNFEKFKEKVLGNLTKKIEILNEGKSCISSASSRNELKNCRKAQQEKMKGLRGEHRKMRMERKANKGKK